jgi:hypothetical protein
MAALAWAPSQAAQNAPETPPRGRARTQPARAARGFGEARCWPRETQSWGRSPAEERMFFFEKKNQKTFSYGVRCRGVRDSTVKSFLLLFFKKEDFPYFFRHAISG